MYYSLNYKTLTQIFPFHNETNTRNNRILYFQNYHHTFLSPFTCFQFINLLPPKGVYPPGCSGASGAYSLALLPWAPNDAKKHHRGGEKRWATRVRLYGLPAASNEPPATRRSTQAAAAAVASALLSRGVLATLFRANWPRLFPVYRRNSQPCALCCPRQNARRLNKRDDAKVISGWKTGLSLIPDEQLCEHSTRLCSARARELVIYGFQELITPVRYFFRPCFDRFSLHSRSRLIKSANDLFYYEWLIKRDEEKRKHLICFYIN